MSHENPGNLMSRREMLALGANALTLAAASAFGLAETDAAPGPPSSGDRVILSNEDSCTLTVIDPSTQRVKHTINLTSFDEDPRPPFRFVTGDMVPSHGAMIQKPLYHGAISVHGCAPSPDSRLLATVGRGSGNLYLIDTQSLAVVGNRPNPRAGPTTNAETLTSGVLVGREPHEPTFTPTGREIWVTLRGEDRIAVLDVDAIPRESSGQTARGASIRGFVRTPPGPAMAWFADGGRTAFVVSQKTSSIEVMDVAYDASGYSTVGMRKTLDISAQDPFGFSPFLRRSPDGREIWAVHKLADRVSVLSTGGVVEARVVETLAIGDKARPNHLEFVENANGRAVYVSCARLDTAGNGIASPIMIIDRSAPYGKRRIVGQFFSQGREAHGIWCDPSASMLFIAHELDELPQQPNEGQTVCTVFDVKDPFAPRFMTQIPLGDLALPSGRLRNKKSVNLVYVRPGMPSATAA